MRVGIVHYINSRPLSRGLLREAGGEFRCELLSPAAIAERLAAGTLDAGLVPSIELARNPSLVVIPGVAIAATHEVRSVLLVSRVPVGEIESVALDESSRTSAALARIVLAERYGLEPEYRIAPADLEAMLEENDAALLIGDPALLVPRDRFIVLDLAGEWLELTRLPFVFAVWAAREEVATGELAETLVASLELGLAELDAIVAETAEETGIAPAVLRDYYTRNLRFEMGAAEQAGLGEFLRRAHAHGLVPAAPPLRFLRGTLNRR